MDQRKYITPSPLLTFAISFFLCLQTALADAWLPKPGTYKYIASVAFVDKDTRKLRNKRQVLYNNLQDASRKLGKRKDELLSLVKDQNRSLTNSEQRAIEAIDNKVAAFLADANYIAIFNENEFGNFSVEHGINENQSFGVRIGYRLDQFQTYLDDGKSYDSFRYGDDINLIYKHKLYSNDKLIITLKQQVQFDRYQNARNFVASTSVLFGYSKTKKNGQIIFQDIGFFIEVPTANDINQGIEITDGIKFKNGIIISNYFRYMFEEKDHIAYNRSIYEQISVGKVIGVRGLKKLDLTLQLGYFWNQSLIDTNFISSGPTFSLWFNI
jgi:hypothetical protein